MIRVKGCKSFPVLRPFKNKNAIVLPVGEVRLHVGVELDHEDNSRHLVVFTESGDRFSVFDDARLNVYSKQHPPEVNVQKQVAYTHRRGSALMVRFDADLLEHYLSDRTLRECLSGIGFSQAVIDQCVQLVRGKEK